MPFFTFRRGGAASAPPAASAAQAESVEVMRKRAKHRLIGSAVLVLIGVIGFPLLFDTQPRPVAGDIPIEIPGKNTVKPLTLPAPAAAKAPAASPAASAEKVADAASLAPQEEILSLKPAPAIVEPAPPAIKKEAKLESMPDPKPEPKVVAKAEPKASVKPEPKPAPKAPAAGAESARAAALLEGDSRAKSPDDAAGGRVVVQVGAFSDEAKARDARLKLEKAGLKTYTQVAETKGGKRIRVRVGPFASRADAEKAASKIKTLDLPAAILTL
jgi:DedD protein